MHAQTRSTQQAVLQQQWVIEEECKMLSPMLRRKVSHLLSSPILHWIYEHYDHAAVVESAKSHLLNPNLQAYPQGQAQHQKAHTREAALNRPSTQFHYKKLHTWIGVISESLLSLKPWIK
jgi:hypothetical protein